MGQWRNNRVPTGQAPEGVVVTRLLEEQRPETGCRHREYERRRNARVDQVLFDVDEEERCHIPQHKGPEQSPLLRGRQVDVVQRFRGRVADVRLVLVEDDIGRLSIISTQARVLDGLEALPGRKKVQIRHGEEQGQNLMLAEKAPKQQLTEDIPRPPLTPRPRRIHQIPAPAIPAAPVPLDHAPRAVFEADLVGSVVVNCRKVSSPRPDENDASEMPNRRGLTLEENATI